MTLPRALLKLGAHFVEFSRSANFTSIKTDNVDTECRFNYSHITRLHPF